MLILFLAYAGVPLQKKLSTYFTCDEILLAIKCDLNIHPWNKDTFLLEFESWINRFWLCKKSFQYIFIQYLICFWNCSKYFNFHHLTFKITWRSRSYYCTILYMRKLTFRLCKLPQVKVRSRNGTQDFWCLKAQYIDHNHTKVRIQWVLISRFHFSF